MIPTSIDKTLDEWYAGPYKRKEAEIASLLHCHPWEIIPKIQHLQRQRDEAIYAAGPVD